MGFEPGMAKPAGSGRRRGTSPKATVQGICAKLHCDPIEGMARLAMDEEQKPDLRGRMYAELAQYVYPKKRAIEHTGLDGGPIEGTSTIEVIYADKTIPE